MSKYLYFLDMSITYKKNFRKIAGYKANTQEQVIFLYPNDKQTEKEIKGTTSFTIVSKKL